MIRIGVVGCGRIARSHIQAIYENPNQCRLTALVDRDRDRALAMAAEFPCGHVFDDVSSAAASGTMDAAIVSLPHDALTPVSRRLLQAGIHVMAEKPCAVSAAEFLELTRLSTEQQLVLLPGYVCRYMPQYRMAKSIVDSGEVGTIHNVAIVHHQATPVIRTEWWRSEAAAGGFFVPIWGSHRIDEVLWILNDFPTSVYASYLRGHLDGVEGESDGAIVLRFGNGAVCNISFSRTAKGVSNTESTFIGSRGSIITRGNSLIHDGNEIPITSPDSAFHEQIGHFCDLIMKRTVVSRCPPADACNVLRIVDAARESDRDRRIVDLSASQ